MSGAHDEFGNRLGTIITLVGSFAGTTSYAFVKLQTPYEPHMMAGYERLLTTGWLALFAVAGYGLLWTSAEGLFGWHFGGGGGPSLPSGWKAIVLSLATTLPLILLPPSFEFISRKAIVLPLHWYAGVAMAAAAALGHLLLYGTATPRILGLRDRVFPQGNPLDVKRAIWMEFIYAAIHFSSTVFVYQIIVHLERLSLLGLMWSGVRTTIAAAIFFLGACSYIYVKFPASLVPVAVALPDGSEWIDSRWVAARGIVNGSILMVAFMIGILLESP